MVPDPRPVLFPKVISLLALKDCSTVQYRYIFNNLYSKADTYQMESRKLEFDPMLRMRDILKFACVYILICHV